MECCKIELRNFLKDNNLIKATDGDLWIGNEWPFNKKIEAKLTLHMQDRLFILLPKNFTNQFKTPIELIECVGYVDTPLFLQPNEQNEFEIRNNMNLFRKKPHPLMYLFNYIMNSIVSTVYELQHAKEINFVNA